MVETLSELLESAANVAEDNGGKLSIASAALPGGLFIYKNIKRQSQTSRQ